MAYMKLFKLILLTFLFYLFAPFIIVTLFLPIYALRSVIKFGNCFLRNNLGNIVCPLSNLFGVDNVYEAPTATLILGSVYEGIVTKELVHQVITENWLNKRDSSGRLFYSELRQGLTKWFGFTFWENDKKFSIVNHVRMADAKTYNFTKDNVKDLFVNLVNSPFHKERSPCEIVIVPDYKTDADYEIPHTLVLFKVHHSLIDGFSMLNLGERVLEDVSTRRNSDNSNFEYNCLYKLAAVLRIPYFIAKFSTNIENVSNHFTPIKKQVTCFNFDKIPLQTLKDLKKKHEVTLSSLLLAGFVAGIRYSLAANCTPIQQLSCVVPAPIPGHPEKLRNHMSFAIIDLPINESCPRKRLLALNENLNQARQSLDILSIFYFLTLIGSLPSWIVKMFVRNSSIPFLLTNFPGLSTPLIIKGHRCKELFFNGGLLEGHIHAICSCIGYEDTVHLAVSADDYFLKPSVELDEFIRAALNELSINL